MSRVSITKSKLDHLADVVSAKSGTPVTLTIDGMADAVLSIETGTTPTGSLAITANGEYNVTDYATANVNVPAPTPTPPSLQNKTVYPTTTQQVIEADAGYDGLWEVTVNAVNLQSKTVSPTAAQQVVEPDAWTQVWHVSNNAGTSGSYFTEELTQTARNHIGESVRLVGSVTYTGYGTSNFDSVVTWDIDLDGLGPYVYPDVTDVATSARLNSNNLRVGLYRARCTSYEFTLYAHVYMGLSSVTVAAMPTGAAGTPTASKGSVSNHAISVTPSVTNGTGYITGGTKTGTAVTVSASELVSGSETKTANGTYDVTNLASLVVAVPIVTYYTSSSTPTSSQGSNGDIWLVTA